MTNIQKETIATMRQKGATVNAIAEKLGLSVNTVKSYCRRHKEIDISKNQCRNCKAILSPGPKTKCFCSDKCRTTWWNKAKKYRTIYQLTCSRCGAPFTTQGNMHQKYCSRKCYFLSRFPNGGNT